MRIKHILAVVVLGMALSSQAQTTDAEKGLKTMSGDTLQGWKKGGMVSLQMNQVSLTNWAAGGLSSISLTGFVNLFANYRKGDLTWDNNLDVGYGIIQQGGSDMPWLKNDDKLDFTSKLGKKAGGNWYYAGLVNFRTQFAEGYATPMQLDKVSDLLAPGYLLGAIGMDYKPNDNLTVFISPLTNKTTFVMVQDLADAGAFGVDAATYNEQGVMVTAGSNVRAELGGYLKLQYQKDVMKNVGFQTKVDLFSNYMHNPQNIDVNWETVITMKVNKYISCNLGLHLIYDDDIDIAVDTNNDGLNDGSGPRTQFKQLFGAGFSYKL